MNRDQEPLPCRYHRGFSLIYLLLNFLGYLSVIYTDFSNDSFFYGVICPITATIYTVFLIWVPGYFLSRNGLNANVDEGESIGLGILGIIPAFISEMRALHRDSYNSFGQFKGVVTSLTIYAEIYFGFVTYSVHFENLVNMILATSNI